MKNYFLLFSIFLSFLIVPLYAQESIPFTALVADNEGIYGVGQGNSLPDNLCAPPGIDPPYYTNQTIMSADNQIVYGGYHSGGHLRPNFGGGINGFNSFIVVMQGLGLDIDHIHLRFTAMDQDNDSWKFVNGLETRSYSLGQFTMVYIHDNGDEEIMLSGEMPVLRDYVNYHDFNDCFDDEISGDTEYFMPVYAAENSSAAIQNAANAFLGELVDVGMKVEFYSLQTAIMGTVDVGAVWSVTSGAIVKGEFPMINLAFEFPAFGSNNQCSAADPVMSTGSFQWIHLRRFGTLVASVLDTEPMGEIIPFLF